MENRLQELVSLGIKPGLHRIERLLAVMGNPHNRFPSVHIAGTNGKGTTAQIIANVFIQAGYRVGRFTSPHLHSYTERFTINNQEIAPEVLLNYLDKNRSRVKAMLQEGFAHPTEFEILTAIAFEYFKDEEVDLAVIEVGMGGVFDSTNVISPLVSVITGIAYDHTAYLGNSLAEIAANKAGIIKKSVPVVTGILPPEAYRVINEKAALMETDVYASDEVAIEVVKVSLEKGYLLNINHKDWQFKNIEFSLLGNYQIKNLATALKTVRILHENGFPVSAEDLTTSLAGLKMPGRMEIIKKEPLVIADVAHNFQGADALAASLQEIIPNANKILLCGILDDKDVSGILSVLGTNTRLCVLTRPVGNRSKNWLYVQDKWQELFPEIPIITEESISAAVAVALRELQVGEYLLITGSFYLMDKARRFFY